MPNSTRRRSSQPNAAAALRLLVALSLGWVFALAIEPAGPAAAQADVQAELRVGDQAPALMADVASAHASLRALNHRVRSGASQPLATPTWLAAVLLPLRFHAFSASSKLEPQLRLSRVIAWSWPLPRSSCHADDEPNARS